MILTFQNSNGFKVLHEYKIKMIFKKFLTRKLNLILLSPNYHFLFVETSIVSGNNSILRTLKVSFLSLRTYS